MNIKTALATLLIFTLSACATTGGEAPERKGKNDNLKKEYGDKDLLEPPVPLKLDLFSRLPMPMPTSLISDSESEKLYSFSISNMSIKDAFRMFSKAYQLNIVVDDDVQGVLDVEFHDLSLKQAIPLMLGNGDYYWEVDNDIVRVRSQKSQQFTVDYLSLIRSGAGSSSAIVSSGSGDSEGGGSAEEAGTVVIGHTDEVNFWKELEEQINKLASEKGSVVINRLSGTVSVTDSNSYVERIAEYLATIERAIHRQVDIEVRIIEVALENNSALGVNWSRIADVMDPTNAVSLNVNGQVATPAGGFEKASDVFSLSFSDTSNGDEITALVSALEEQGDVKIVSQPHIRTINNQTSLIKVGTDRTFFRREQSTDSTSAGSITTSSDIAQVVTEGVVLSITPQISSSGHILLDISPVVTRVSSVATVRNGSGQIQSSAPNLDVAQVTSLVRAVSGETVVIGGLIQTQKSDTERNIPGTRWLGPLKNLAGGNYKVDVKKELIMILTPIIVDAGQGI